MSEKLPMADRKNDMWIVVCWTESSEFGTASETAGHVKGLYERGASSGEIFVYPPHSNILPDQLEAQVKLEESKERTQLSSFQSKMQDVKSQIIKDKYERIARNKPLVTKLMEKCKLEGPPKVLSGDKSWSAKSSFIDLMEQIQFTLIGIEYYVFEENILTISEEERNFVVETTYDRTFYFVWEETANSEITFKDFLELCTRNGALISYNSRCRVDLKAKEISVYDGIGERLLTVDNVESVKVEDDIYTVVRYDKVEFRFKWEEN